MILAGDIGGTSTRLAVFELRNGRLAPAGIEGVFSSAAYGNFSEVVRPFIASRGLVFDHACFGVAGPIRGGRSKISNLPWVIDARELSTVVGVNQVWLINDLEALAYGVGGLEAEDFLVLNEGARGARGNCAVIAAGTGLGEAGLYWDGHEHHPFACEGGHADFAPRNELEMSLLQHLLARFEHVSYERALSGSGLYNIYQFLRERTPGEEPAWLAEAMQHRGAPGAISTAALAGTCAVCVGALDVFVSVYGAEAGNLALKVLALGGVYVGGGIAPKIAQKLRDGTFVEAFVTKGRMRTLLEAVPVRAILNEGAGLLGAARYAVLRASLPAA